MIRTRLFPASQAFLFLAAGATLAAQESGTLHGTVREPSGSVVAGVKVILDSPALFSPRVMTTDASGAWRAPLLPVGTYKVTLTKEGYDSSSRGQLRLGIANNVRIDMVIAPVRTQVVDVVATSSVVDKTQVNAGANFSADALSELPLVNRSFAGALDMTPGTSAGTDGVNYVIRGGSTTNTNYRVNGAEVKDDYANALGSNWVIEDNIEDAQVTTSQVNVRFGRALGGAVNVITKSGSNVFAGSVRAKLSKDGWKARTVDTASYEQWGDNLNREYNVTFRGPIVKDRLWFSVGTILKPGQTWMGNLRAFSSRANAPMLTGDAGLDARLNAGPGNGYGLAYFDKAAPYVGKFDSTYTEGKLTAALSTNHTLEASFVDKKDTTSNAPGSSRGVRLATLGESWQKYQMASFAYSGIFGPAAFLEARYTQTKNLNLSGLGDPAYPGEGVYVEYGRKDHPESGIQNRVLPFGFPYGSSPENHGNINASVNLKLMPTFHGSHDLDMGLEYFDSYTDNGEGWGTRNLMFFVGGAYSNATGDVLFPTMNFPGFGNYYQTFDPGYNYSYGAAPFVREAMGPKGRAHCKQVGLYVNDSWTIDSRWMVGAGIRMDHNRAIDVDGHDLAKSTDATYSAIARWDLKGDSSHLLTFTASSSAGSFNQALFGQFTAKATTVEIQRGWSANAKDPGAGLPDQVIGFVPYRDLVDLKNYGRIVSFIDQTKRNVLADDLRAPRAEEATLGYKRAYANQSRIGITLVYRRWRDMWAQRYDWADPYVIAIQDPSHSGLPDKLDITRRYDNSNDLKREYRAVEVEFAKPFGTRWVLMGNYTYSRLTGNWDDGDIDWGGWRNNDPTMGTLTWNPIVLQRMGLTTSDYAPSGLLSNNQSHKARLALTHILPVGKDGKLTFSAMLSYDSGRAWSAANYAAIDQTQWPTDLGGKYGDKLGIAPDQVYQQYYSALGAYSSNDVYSVDLKITWDFPLSFLKAHFIGDCKVGNVFNNTMPVGAWRALVWDGEQGTKKLYMDTPGSWGTQPALDDGTRWHTGGRWATFSCGLRF